MTEDGTIDKALAYGQFQKAADAREKLALRMAHKALDIGEDDMEIHAPKTTTVTGLGAGAVAGIAGLAALVPTALAAFLLFRPAPTAPPVIQQPAMVSPTSQAQPQAQRWRVDFWVEDGKTKTKLTPID